MKNCILIQGRNASPSIPFIVRLVLKGDGYGVWNSETNQWALRHKEAEPLVEFYDARYSHTPYGQFTGARYRLETMLEQDSAEVGLNLHGGEPDWSINAQNMRKVQEWLTQYRQPPQELYAVTARINGDDDDSIFMITGTSEESVRTAARNIILSERNEPDTQEEGLVFVTGCEKVLSSYGSGANEIQYVAPAYHADNHQIPYKKQSDRPSP